MPNLSRHCLNPEKAGPYASVLGIPATRQPARYLRHVMSAGKLAKDSGVMVLSNEALATSDQVKLALLRESIDHRWVCDRPCGDADFDLQHAFDSCQRCGFRDCNHRGYRLRLQSVIAEDARK